jgi:hypothetical protein
MTHVFTVGVLRQTLVDLLLLRLLHCRIDHVPKANCTVGRTGHELSEAVFVFAAEA